MNDFFIKLHQYSVGKYWKQCRLIICLELGITNTSSCLTWYLPKLLFHMGCPQETNVLANSWAHFHRCCTWILLYHSISENSVSQELTYFSITCWSYLHQCLFFLKVRISFYNLDSYYWNTKLRSLILAINITPFSCSVCIFIVMQLYFWFNLFII